MIAVSVSGRSYVRQAFRKKLQESLPVHGAKVPKNNITWLGENGVFGILSGQEICFTRLKLK